MSDPKRGGSKDISDLKARLGLKKGAAATGSTAATNGTEASKPAARTEARSGGVVPPPGLNLPPPPGVQPSQPAAPAIPNAADDPFGAMNAMAAVGTVQRAPEIVIVNDGKPVENVGSQSRGATIAKIAIPAVVGIAVGVAIGQIAKGANVYNQGLKDSRTILGDQKTPSTVANVKQSLSKLDTALDEIKTKNNYRPDLETDTQLKTIATALDVKADQVFRTAGAVDPVVSGQIMSFYAGVAEVKNMLDAHVKAAASDDIALKKAKKGAADAALKETENAMLASGGWPRYGVLIQSPTEADKTDFGAKVVELGPPYCGGSNPETSGKCPNNEAPTAYTYRNDPGATWSKGELVTQGSDNVPTKKLLPLLPNGTRDALLKSADGSAAEVFYAKRLRTIADRTKKLLDEANKLQSRLEAEANKPTRFSFFL